MNIWILDSKSSLKIFYKSYLKTNIDEDIVSGLLNAFNQFTMSEFHQPIESIEMGGFRWIYLPDLEYNVLFIAADTKSVSTEKLRNKLNIIKEAFIRNYKQVWINRGKTWSGDLRIFFPFEEQIDNYFYDWEEAEIFQQLGIFQQILGIFQQILILINGIIGNQIGKDKIENIHKRIEDLLVDFHNQPEIKDDLELRKISFSRVSGFNVIDINPTNCDPIIAKTNLINILINIIKIFKEEIGIGLSLKYFRDGNIYDYIFNNMELLREFNLANFLLKNFLLLEF